MPTINRRSKTPPPDLTAQEGDQPCSQQGCPAATGLPCHYTDRRGHACGTAWCPKHRVVVDERLYCPRHGGTVRALGAALNSSKPETRCAALVDWISRSVDLDFRDLLLELPGRRSDERYVAEPVHLVFGTTHGRERRWTRAWKLIDNTAVTTVLALEVDEDRDTEVQLRVNGEEVVCAVPPWIQHRQRGEQLTHLEDRLERSHFDQFLVATAREALLAARRREEELRPPRLQRPRTGKG